MDLDAFRARGGPLAEAMDKIDKLLDLCSRHGLKREAYSIVIGRDIPKPARRRPGAPLVKGARYHREVAALVEIEALGPRGRRGARTRVARMLAKTEVGEQNRSPAWRSDLKRRARSRENDLSRLTPLVTIEAAYYVRRIRAGESLETAKARLDAYLAGDKRADKELREILSDFVADQRFSQKFKKVHL